MEKSTILIIDDDANAVASVRDVLLRAGFAVDTAESGRDALGKLLDDKQPGGHRPRHPHAGDGRAAVPHHRPRLSPAGGPSRCCVLTAVDLAARSWPSRIEVVMRKPFRADGLVANVEELVSRGVPHDAS